MLIDSEDVKQAIIQRLLEIFPSTSVYKEAKSNVSYPHFFVYQRNLTDKEERKGCHIITYKIDVIYRVAGDSSTDLKLQQNLDNVIFKLTQKFNIIDFEESKIKCTNKTFDKSDGELHFLFDVVIMAYDTSYNDDDYKMGKFNLSMRLKNV